MKTKFCLKQWFEHFCFQTVLPKAAAAALGKQSGGWAIYVCVTCFCSTRSGTNTSSAPSRQPRFDLSPSCLQAPPACVHTTLGSDAAAAPRPSALPRFIVARAGGCESTGIQPCCKQAPPGKYRVQQHRKFPSRDTHRIRLTFFQQRGHLDRVLWREHRSGSCEAFKDNSVISASRTTSTRVVVQLKRGLFFHLGRHSQVGNWVWYTFQSPYIRHHHI